jgi:hypothetical protein
MKVKRCFVLIAVIITALCLISASASVNAEKMQEINALDLSVKPQDINPRGTVKPDLNFGKFPLYFIFNKGQVNEKAKFYAKASRYTLWLTKEGLVFDSFKKFKVKVEVEEGKETTHPAPSGHPSQEDDTPRPLRGHPSQEGKSAVPHLTHSPKLERDVSRLVFLDANKNLEMVAIEESKLKVNYFIGNDKSKWHCDVPTSQAVLYKNLYKDIDLKVYGIEKQIEYDWIVKPGGNPKDIRFEYKNVKGTRLDKEGNLLIETDFGELMHKKPVSYQKRKAQSTGVGAGLRACPLNQNKNRKIIDVTFKKIGKNTYGVEVGEYDKSCELIIDPVVLAYSTYLGGGNWDGSWSITVDSIGYIYVTGSTLSIDFPTRDQYLTDQGGRDAFVTKLDTTQSGASGLIYSTYLGGNGIDYGCGIAVDSSFNAYVSGWTSSTDFPILNQYQNDQGGVDVFVTKLDTTQSGGLSLIYSTYFGGGSTDYCSEIDVDTNGYAYVIGATNSTDLPTLNQFQTFQGGSYDAFVTKLDTNSNGNSSLIYSTYLGGNFYDYGEEIAVDNSGHAYVIGETTSSDFPTRNHYQTDQGGRDVFVTKLDTTQSGASSLNYSTYLGGNGYEFAGYGIAVDSLGYVYVSGRTDSSDFPVLNQYQVDQPGRDAFVTKLDTTQSGVSSLIYSTYLGGSGEDNVCKIAVDNSGCVYVTGYTVSTDFPILDQYQVEQPGRDAFVTKLDTTQCGASSLIYSTYLGGNGSDYGIGIALDNSGNAYIAGWTESTDFPILNQFQIDQGGYDAFVTKLSFIPPNSPPVAVCKDIEISADENCQAIIKAEYVDDGSYDPDNDPITLSIDNAGPFSLGEHEVNLTVTDEQGELDTCQAAVTVVDTTPPLIEHLSASQNVLWPPNHKMVAVTLDATVSDNCDLAPNSKIVSVSSNEPVNGTGDGDRTPDWEITGDLTVNLRAERSGKGSGRVYTVTVMCTDASGNISTGTINISVPHDIKGR